MALAPFRENEGWFSTYAITDFDPPILICVRETDPHLVYQPTRMSVGRGEALQLHTFRVPNGVVGPHKMKVVARHTRASSGLMTIFSMAGLPLSAAESIPSDLNEYSVHCPASVNLSGHH